MYQFNSNVNTQPSLEAKSVFSLELRLEELMSQRDQLELRQRDLEFQLNELELRRLTREIEQLDQNIAEEHRQQEECLQDLQEIEKLVKRQADLELKDLVFNSLPQDRRNAIAALQEALTENRVASPMHYIKCAIKRKWTPNHPKMKIA